MTPNRLAAIAFRWSISAVFALWVFAPNAQSQSAATAVSGVYCVESYIPVNSASSTGRCNTF